MLSIDRATRLLERLPIRDRFSRRLIPFTYKPGQDTIARAAERQQSRGRPIRIICLKARRVGVSSWTDSMGVLHGLSTEAALGLIVAHQFKSSKGLFEVPTNLVSKHLPHKRSLCELMGIGYTKHQISIPRNSGDSLLDLATAGSVESGRGLSFTFLHLSEAAFFPGIQSFVSLLPTVPYDPSTWVVIESTANGRVGPGASFYDYWMNSVEGQTDYEAVFLPWHQDPTCVRPDDDAPDAPADDYERWLMSEFHSTRGQIAWWRNTLESECKGNMQLMQQEYPASPEEAFMATGDPAFEHEELAYARSTVADPIAVGDIKCPINNYTTPFFESYGAGDWAIWQMPQPGYHYFFGVDAARGLQMEEGDFEPSPEGDFASAVGWCAETGEQVCRLAKRIHPEALAEKCNAAGRYYNKAMVNIELTGNLGVWAQKVLRDPPYNYPNLYRWRGGRDDRLPDQNRFFKKMVVGWETTVRTREMMFDAYRAAIRLQNLAIRDRILLAQMENATRKEGFRWEVIRGHDDVLIAACIGWMAREQWGPPTSGSTAGQSKKPQPEGEPQPAPGTYQRDIVDQSRLHQQRIIASIKRKIVDNREEPASLQGI